jgi:ATP-binding cassette, subfamily C (CFTR/MRP), member 4
VKTFWKELIFLGLLQFFNDIIIRLFQPFFLGLLLNYFAPNSDITKREAYLYAIAVVALNFLASISINQFMFRSLSIGMKIRVAASSLIYRKSLRVASKALKQTSVGNIVNLLTHAVFSFIAYGWHHY